MQYLSTQHLPTFPSITNTAGGMGRGWGKRTGGDVKGRILSVEIKPQITTPIKAGLQALDPQCCLPCRKKAWQNQERVQMTAQKAQDSDFSSEIWGGIQTNRWRTDMQEKVLNWASGTQHRRKTQLPSKWQKLPLTFYTGLQQIIWMASTARNHPEIWPVGFLDKTSSSPTTKTSYFCFPINNAT